MKLSMVPSSAMPAGSVNRSLGSIGSVVRSNDMAESQTNLAWDVLIDLTQEHGTLHERLTRALRAAIRAGRLPTASALPPSRILAARLKVSRWTVTQAYTQLIAEGYLEARAGSATRVRWTPDPGAQQSTGAARGAAVPARLDMTPGRPDLQGFPVTRWVEAIRRAAATTPYSQLGYPEPAGTLRLRQTLADYLNRVRGTSAAPDSVTICLRAADAMVRACRAMLADGISHLAVEDPGWPQLREAAAYTGMVLVPLTADKDGMQVEQLSAHPEVGAVCVGATHQFPTGGVLAPGRRAILLEWAKRRNGLIIEDDYDAEFRYDRPPVSALQGMAPQRVLLLGSVSKTLTPTVGIGWLVSPLRLVAAVRAASPFPLVPPILNQLALAWFIESGSYDRYLHAARKRYQARRHVLLDALGRLLPTCRVEGAAAGLHVLLRLPPGSSASHIVASAARRGLLIADLDQFRMRPNPARPGLVLGYGNLADSVVGEAVSALAEILGG
jgi:GntR family transcriptional regulator/MocR family aminotransferase